MAYESIYTMLCPECEVAKTPDDEPVGLEADSSVDLTSLAEGRVMVSDLSHPTLMLDMLRHLWCAEQFCDVTLRTEQHEFRAHRAILAAASPYFRTMFSCSYKESEVPVVELMSFDGEILQPVLNYVYTGVIELSLSTVAAVLGVADYLQFSSLRHHCLQYLRDAASADTSVTVWRLAELHRAPELARHALRLIQDNFMLASRDQDFMTLSEKDLSTILQTPYLSSREDHILYSLCRWAEVDLESRLPSFRRLLQHINHEQLDLAKLRSATELHPSLQDTEVREYLAERREEVLRLKYDRATESESDPSQQQTPAKPRRFTEYMEMIVAVGGATCAGFSSGAECLTLGYDSWKYAIPRTISSVTCDVTSTEPMARMAEMRMFAAVASDGDHLYVLGGFRDITSLRTCERYSVRDNAFSPLPHLPGCLHGGAAAIAGGRLYLMGGSLDGAVTDKVWMYSEERKEWLERSPMIGARSHHCSAVIRGHIYVIGGLDHRGVYLSTVSRYDPDSDQWTVAPPCGPPRAYAGCAVVRDQAYLIGGHSGRQWLRTVRRYSPLENQWHGLGVMSQPLGQFATAVFDDRIYCIGGFTGSDYLRSVNKYNPRTDRWHAVHSMHMARMGLAAATVRVPVVKDSEV